MPNSRLVMPIEIHERVIDAVRTNYTTLLQCALTCRAWLPRSRYNLFCRPILRSVVQLSLFLRTLRNHPPSGLEPLPTEITEELTLAPAAPTVPPTFVHSACALLAGFVPRLKKLNIVFSPSQCRNFRYGNRLDLPPRMIAYIAQFPALTHLTFRDIELTSFMALARLIVALPSLSALALCNVSWPKVSLIPSTSPFTQRNWLKLEHIMVRRTATSVGTAYSPSLILDHWTMDADAWHIHGFQRDQSPDPEDHRDRLLRIALGREL